MNFPPKAPANGANVHMTVPLFNVTDMAASREFYIGGLGFRQKLAWTPDDSNAMRWCWSTTAAAPAPKSRPWPRG